MNISFEPNKQDIIDLVNEEITLLQNKEEDLPYSTYFGRIYKMDLDKPGNKKFVSKQSQVTQEHRHKIKRLLREYLKLKINDNDPQLYFNDPIKDKIIRNNNKVNRIKGNIFRFNIKLDSRPIWFEISRNFGKQILSFEKNGNRDYRILSNNERILFQKGILTRIFNGSQLEYIDFNMEEKLPDSFWSVTKTKVTSFNGLITYLPFYLQHIVYSIGDLFFPTTHFWNEYQSVIHPALTEVALACLRDSKVCPNIVEICGGSGDLAERIAENYSNQMNYYLLENNDHCLYLARKRFKNKIKEKNISITFIKTDVTNSNDYFIDVKKQKPMLDNSVDLILGSGALTAFVLENKQTALVVAKKCYKLLKPNGKLILAGHAHSLLNNEDFTNLGFKIINSFLVGMQNYPIFTINMTEFPYTGFNKQFYVLEKND